MRTGRARWRNVCEHLAVRFLAEPANSLSDALLGAVSLGAAAALGRPGTADPAFTACLGAMGSAAAWGAVHHALITPTSRLRSRSWTAIATMLAGGIGFLFAASARATLPAPTARQVAPLGAIGPAVYLAFAASGRRDMNTMVAAQGLSMAGVVGMWIAATARRQQGASLGLTAVVLSAAATAARSIPPSALARVKLDPDSAYHLAQIPGVLVLACAARGVTPHRQPVPYPA